MAMQRDELATYWDLVTFEPGRASHIAARAAEISREPATQDPVLALRQLEALQVAAWAARLARDLTTSDEYFWQAEERLYHWWYPLPHSRARLYHRWSRTKAYLGDFAAGDRLLRIACDLAHGSRNLLGQNAYYTGLLRVHEDRFQEALELFKNALLKIDPEASINDAHFYKSAALNWLGTAARLPELPYVELEALYAEIVERRLSSRSRRPSRFSVEQRRPRRRSTDYDAALRWIQGMVEARLGDRRNAVSHLCSAAETFRDLGNETLYALIHLDLVDVLLATSQRVHWLTVERYLRTVATLDQSPPAICALAERLLFLARRRAPGPLLVLLRRKRPNLPAA